jgi:hypothetical protein
MHVFGQLSTKAVKLSSLKKLGAKSFTIFDTTFCTALNSVAQLDSGFACSPATKSTDRQHNRV